ncbi:MAG: hypothetical protein A2Y97_05110 [Nitrospirae bacterium RBG_13_39_12]|nr:MAG: hypothetical protein A2Y97_05110 [Nitrospirae bacterium RBG_13_39_12]
MKKNLKEKLHYESKFEYSKGIIRTPEKWKNYFWAAYYKKILSSLRSKITKYNRVVFIGIGYGDIVPSLQFEDRIKIIGIDVNFNSLLSAKEHTSVIMADGSCLPLKSNNVDLVVCNQVLHHIIGQGTLDATINECHRILKCGGEFIAVEPNSMHPSGALINIANRFHKYHFLTGGSDHEFAISPFHIFRVLRNNGFSILKSSAVTFSHPRFPLFIQKIINVLDNKLSRFYMGGLINLYIAVK